MAGEQIIIQKAGEKARGVSTNTLKLLAIIAMVCDHIQYMMPDVHEQYYAFPWFLMHAVGRLTAPIFFYLVAVGYGRTRNANRYTVRLLVFALLTYAPYVLYFHGEGGRIGAENYFYLNVIFTMLFGLLLLRTLHEARSLPLKAVLLVLCLIGGYWCDYGLYGIAMILICDLARGAHHARLATVLGIATVMMVSVYVHINDLFRDSGPHEIAGYLAPGAWSLNPWLMPYVAVQLCQLLPLILIARHRVWFAGLASEARPRAFAKWGFYIFYPAHITALLLVRMFMLGVG